MREDFSCIKECPDSYYKDESIRTCKKCVPPCKTCSNESICLSCVKDYYLYKEECVNVCPKGYYQYKDICTKCSDNCSACLGTSEYCIECKDGLRLNISNKCEVDCPPGYYNNDGICSKCSNGCEECVSVNECIRCFDNYDLLNNKCLPKSCPDNQIMIRNKCIDVITCIDSFIIDLPKLVPLVEKEFSIFAKLTLNEICINNVNQISENMVVESDLTPNISLNQKKFISTIDYNEGEKEFSFKLLYNNNLLISKSKSIYFKNFKV